MIISINTDEGVPVRFEIALDSPDLKELKVKECSCGHFHLQGSDWQIHLSEAALFSLYERLENAIDILQKRKTEKRPVWFRGLYQNSPKHT